MRPLAVPSRPGRYNTRAFSAMRIGFDGRSLASPAGGVRRYAGELLDELVRISPSDTIVIFGASADPRQPRAAQSVPVRQTFPTNLGWSLIDLPRAIRRERLDVFHAPAYTAPLRVTVPLVLTIHDVSYERHPNGTHIDETRFDACSTGEVPGPPM